MQVERPRRPARSLQDFRILYTGDANRRGHNPDDSTFWPCIECSGGGRIRDPADREAAPWHHCPSCKGSGIGTKEAIKAIYDEAVAKYKAAIQEYRRNYALWRSVLRKTTREEKDALEAFGIRIKRRGVNVRRTRNGR